MIFADKGNKVIQISENEVQRYISQGFTIMDEKGTVLKDAVPNDISSLRIAYDKLLTENKQLLIDNKYLQGEIEKLNSQIAELKSAKPTKRVEEDVETKSDEVSEQPKRSRRSKVETE